MPAEKAKITFGPVSTRKPFVVGIAGGSGSGKTSFLKALMSHFAPGQLALVSQDNYYKPKAEQTADENGIINFDLPTAIDRDHFFNDLQCLMRGETIVKREYNFNNPAWIPEEVVVQPAPVIIMEGLFIFHFEEINRCLDYRVFLDAHHEQRLQRRIERDARERGYPEHEVKYQWHCHVRPAEEKYLVPFVNQCHLVIDNTSNFESGLNELAGAVNEFIEAHGTGPCE